MFAILKKLDYCIGKIVFPLLYVFSPGLAAGKKISPERIKKILCIKLWGLGNLTIILPLLHKIKLQFPNAQLLFLTFDSNRDFFKQSEIVDRVYFFPFTRNFLKIIYYFISFRSSLRKENIDLAINFEQCNNVSLLMLVLAKITFRIGLRTRFRFVNAFYTKTVKNNPAVHISNLFSDILLPLGINRGDYSYSIFKVNAQAKDKVQNLLKKINIKNRFVCIHPGCSVNFKGKRWDYAYFSRFADDLIKRHGTSVIFTGNPEEVLIINKIILNMQKKAFNFASLLNVAELIELLRISCLFVSNDTGPVHIAASLGINTAVVYGPTSPNRYRPLNKNSICFYKNLNCSPCLYDSNYKVSLCMNPKCLSISPETVLDDISKKFFIK